MNKLIQQEKPFPSSSSSKECDKSRIVHVGIWESFPFHCVPSQFHLPYLLSYPYNAVRLNQRKIHNTMTYPRQHNYV